MLHQIRKQIQENNIDAYILYDYKSQNKILTKLLSIKQVPTRRIVYILDKDGKDTLIIPSMEQVIFAEFDDITEVYSSHKEFSEILKNKIADYKNIILDFDHATGQAGENNFFPAFDIVPHGFVTLLKNLNPNLTYKPSLPYIQSTLGNWGKSGYASHIAATGKLKGIFDATTLELQSKIDSGITEFELRTFILRKFKKNNLITNRYGCLVASGVNSADPHYIPTKQIDRKINKNELVLIDLWAKEDSDDSIYADNTFIIWTGDNIPVEVQNIWELVTNARNMATDYLWDNLPNREVKGFEVDKLVREYFKKQSVLQYAAHRVGHSLDESVHGLGTHLDSIESYDTRSLNENCGVTIEPGLYLPGKFGIRSEINVYIDKNGTLEVTSWVQSEIVCIS